MFSIPPARTLASATLAFFLAGCAAPDATQPKADRPPSPPPSPAAPPASLGEVTLSKASQLTLQHHPGLRAAELRTKAAHARAFDAGRAPNPEFEAEIEEFAGTGPFSGTDAASTTFSLAQTFPLGGDRRISREHADTQTRIANLKGESKRIAVMTELTQRYVTALAQRERRRLAASELKLAESVLNTAKKRVAAGDAPGIQTLRAEVPVSRARVALRNARRREEMARRELALMWNHPETSFTLPEAHLDDLGPSPSMNALAELLSRHPDLETWAAEVAAHRLEQRLARAERIPDLTGRVGVQRFNENGESAFLAAVALPLPLFDRNRGAIDAARHAEHAAASRRDETRLQLTSTLMHAHAALVAAREEALALETEALPAAESAFDATRTAFDRGDLPILDVLDAERTLVELRHAHLDALVAFHLAAAEIEGLIGQPLPAQTN